MLRRNNSDLGAYQANEVLRLSSTPILSGFHPSPVFLAQESKPMKLPKISSQERTRMLRPATVTAVVSPAMALLLGLFPGRQRLKALIEQWVQDGISITYLQLLLRTRSRDTALRWAVVHKLTTLGKWNDARNALAPLLSHAGALGQQARLAALEIDFSKVGTLMGAMHQRSVVQAAIAAQIQQLKEENLSVRALQRMAQISSAIDRPDLAAVLHRKLATIDSVMRQAWLELAAKAYIASDEPRAAAQAYHEAAFTDHADVSMRRRYIFLAMDAYLRANESGTALALAQAAAPELGNDDELMRRVVAITLQQNDIGRALHMGRHLLKRNPEDAAILSMQVDVELAASDYAAALELARRIHLIEPANHDKRAQLARIAERADQPSLALEHWAWLAHREPGGTAMVHALRLAHASKDDMQWLDLAVRLLAMRPLKRDELAGLAAIRLRGKHEKQLYAFLQTYVRRYPGGQEIWQALAKLQEKFDDVTGEPEPAWCGATLPIGAGAMDYRQSSGELT